MYISKLIIKGFRCFGPEVVSIDIKEKLVAFIGLNSSGKTAALEALRKLFGNYSEQQIYREDFHISDSEYPESSEAKYFHIEVRIDFSEKDEAVPSFFSDMVIGEQGQTPYLRIRLEAIWKRTNLGQQGDIEQQLYFIKTPDEEEEDGNSKKQYPRYLRSLIQLIYVPALRKPADQIKYSSGSILYRVLNNIDYDDDFKKKFDKVIEETNSLFKGVKEFKTIQDSLQEIWNRFHTDLRFKDSNINFGSSELEAVLKKLEINFSPAPGSRKFDVNDLGDGYRSLFYLTLVCTLLEIEEKLTIEDEIDNIKRPLLTLLAIEEPENHIAPQLLGRVMQVLLGIAKKTNTQVFLTSHSPSIIKRIDPESIYHFRISKKFTTMVNNIELPEKKDDAYKYVKQAVQNYPEIYFARLVVIGEGDSEEVVFTRLMKIMNKDFDDNCITFAPLGHRFVNHIWKLLKKLQIPSITLLDMDLEREGGGWGRIKYILNELIKRGENRSKLLEVEGGGELDEDEFDRMHEWEYDDINDLQAWREDIEKYDVFYSYPLDLDFLMLETFPQFYTSPKSFPIGGGPRIPDRGTQAEDFDEYLLSAIHSTLKSDKTNGYLYTEPQKQLMIWYKYHFLGRGKPATHIQVLPEIPDGILEDKLPSVFINLFYRIEELLAAET